MAMGSTEMYPVIFTAFVLVSALLVVLYTLRIRNWSDEMYAAAVGVLVVGATIVAAYTLCLIIGPILAKRYILLRTTTSMPTYAPTTNIV